MADDTAAALVIQLSADFKQFANQMRSATGVFDKNARDIERRQQKLKKNLESAWGKIALPSFAIGTAAVGGFGVLIKKALDAASAIGDTAIASNTGIEKLQELEYAASQSGATFDDMDAALIRLNRSIGDALTKGTSQAAQAFKQIGIDPRQIKNTGQAFDLIVAKLHGYGNEAQKSSILTQLFGEQMGPKLLQLVDQGSAGIAALEAKAKSLGIVLSANAVNGAKKADDALDSLFATIGKQGEAALVSFAPEIIKLTSQISDNLPVLIAWANKWAEWFGLIKADPVQKLEDKLARLQAKQRSGQYSIGDLFGETPNATITALLIKQTEQQLAAAKAAQAAADAAGGASVPTPPPKGTAPTATAPTDQQARLLDQAVTGAHVAAAAMAAAQNQLNMDMLQGSAGYYAAVQKQIEDTYQAAVQAARDEAKEQIASLGEQGTSWAGYGAAVNAIQDAMTAKIKTAALERDNALYGASAQAFMKQALKAGDEQLRQYAQQAAALGVTTGALAKMTYVQQQLNDAKEQNTKLGPPQIKQIEAEGDAIGQAAQHNAEVNKNLERSIELADGFRGGLEDVLLAGTHSFKGLKSAAADFLSEMSDMIIRLYVIKPLVESLFGPAGAALGTGGGIGSFISSFFASGGLVRGPGSSTSDSIPARLSDGEFVVNANATRRNLAVLRAMNNGARWPGYADGGLVSRVSQPPRVAAANSNARGAPLIYNDMRGAVMTEQLYRDINRISSGQAAAAVSDYDRNALPTRVAMLKKNPHVR